MSVFRFGFKRVFGLSMLAASILTLMTPLAATHGGLAAAVTVRVVLGFCHGVVFPAMHGAWTHWAHPEVNKWKCRWLLDIWIHSFKMIVESSCDMEAVRDHESRLTSDGPGLLRKDLSTDYL